MIIIIKIIIIKIKIIFIMKIKIIKRIISIIKVDKTNRN